MNHEGYNDLCIGGCAAAFCGIGYPILSVCFSRCMEALMVPEEQFDVMRSQVNRYAFYLLLLAIGEFFAYLVMYAFMGRAGEKLERKIKYTIFRHLLRLDLEFYDSGEEGSEAVALMLLNDTSSLKDFGGSAVGQILASTITMLVGVFVAISADWRLGLVCASCMPVLITSGFLLFKVQSRFQKRTKKAYEASAIFAGETISCIKAVNSLTREKHIIKRYFDEVEEQIQRSRKDTVRTAAFYALAQMVSPLCISLGFWYGSVLLLQQEIDIYQFYVSFMAIVTGSQAVQSIFSYAPAINEAKKCTSNIVRLLDKLPELDECSVAGTHITRNSSNNPSYGGTLVPVLGTIELRDVYFRYAFEPELTVLSGVSFKVNSGEFAVIVSPQSNSESSTLLELLERFYKPLSGEILMDGWKIAELNLENYRYQLGYVHPKAVLLEEISIMDNMLIGLSDGEYYKMTMEMKFEMVFEACKKAHIHEFILNLPDGYDTVKGIVYSESQRIRLALARAIVRNPRVLLIDMLSNDQSTIASSKEVIMAAINSVAKGRTTIMVTSDVGLTESADQVMVMDKGRIIEQGVRHMLLMKQGKYSLMMQQRQEQKY